MRISNLPNMLERDSFLWCMSWIERPIKVFGLTIPFLKTEVDSFVYNEEIFEANGAKRISNSITQSEYAQAVTAGLAILCQSDQCDLYDIDLFKEIDDYSLLTKAITDAKDYRLYTIPIKNLSNKN